MDKQQLDAIKAFLDSESREKGNRKLALERLRRAGIVDASGQLAEPYRSVTSVNQGRGNG
jgi:hypothetical protein